MEAFKFYEIIKSSTPTNSGYKYDLYDGFHLPNSWSVLCMSIKGRR